MTPEQIEALIEAAEKAARNIRLIAEGDSSGVSGCEAIAGALAGENLRADVGGSLHAVSASLDVGLQEVADAIREHAGAVESLANAIAGRGDGVGT